MLESNNTMVKQIFEADPNHTEMSKGKLSFISVGSKFRTQLTTLMEKLRSTVSKWLRFVDSLIESV